MLNLLFYKSVLVMILLLSVTHSSDCSTGAFTFPAGTLTNSQYASLCRADGWNVDELNTGLNSGYLTEEEKNLILATNMVRTDPAKFAELYVKEVIGYYNGKYLMYPGETPILTKEGRTPATQLYRQLMSINPMGILIPSPGMSKAARNHAQSQSISGQTGHGPTNSLSKRLNQQGTWHKCMGENITYGPKYGHHAVLELLIDDNVRSRDHRRNILDTEYTFIGVGSATHKKYRWTFVVTYACAYTEFSN